MDGEQRNPSSPSLQRLSFETDAGEGARARMGLLVLESDQTVEAEFRALLNPLPDVSVYHARLANDTQVTPETLARMEEELPVAASLIPGYMGLSVVGYGCTSGSTIIGEDRVAEIMTTAHPGAAATNPLTAAKAALAADTALSELRIQTQHAQAMNAQVSVASAAPQPVKDSEVGRLGDLGLSTQPSQNGGLRPEKEDMN